MTVSVAECVADILWVSSGFCPGMQMAPSFLSIRTFRPTRFLHILFSAAGRDRGRFLRLVAPQGQESELPHPAKTVLQRPEVHEFFIRCSQEEHLLHLHPLARRGVP